MAVNASVPSLRPTVVAGGKAGGGIDWTLERLLDHFARAQVEIGEHAGGGGLMHNSGTTGPPKRT